MRVLFSRFLARYVSMTELRTVIEAAILITSKSFDPKAFLSTIHPNATYQDLTAGTTHLKQTLDSRSEAIRVLVEDNFDHYVSVKASTESKDPVSFLRSNADFCVGEKRPVCRYEGTPPESRVKLRLKRDSRQT